MSNFNLIGHSFQLRDFLVLYKNNSLPAKILLSGKKGIGKSLLVKQFLLNVFSENKSRIQIENSTHSNILNISCNEEKKNIEIDQIRKILKFTNQSSLNNKSRFIIIDDVEFLNVHSSNALLKTLEEPNYNVYFFLIFNSQMHIRDTIKSRCIEYKLNLQMIDTITIINNYFNEEVYININDSLKNYYSTPKFLISLVNYLNENNLSIYDTDIKSLILYIIDNKHYIKHRFIKEHLNYIIELFFYNHINIRKKISYNVKKYYYSKFSCIQKFNLDYESFFLEFRDKLLNE